MYVCVCKAVTDRQIREAAQGGARTLKDLRRELGVTSECGRCASCAHECLRQVRTTGCTDPQALLKAA
jgi:bacterioferritin-associated ferredoxin